mgnify:CR=1 FL=1
MKLPKQLRLGVPLLALLVGIADCAVDARTSPALVDALADGPVRDYASLQADTLAQAGFALRLQVVPDSGAPPNLQAAQKSWLRARAAYEGRGKPLVEALRKAQVPARLSRDTGRYVCNASYWRMLGAMPKATEVVFIHIPLPAKHGVRKRDPRPTMDAMTRGVTGVIRSMIARAGFRR